MNNHNDLGISKNIILRMFYGFFLFLFVFFIIIHCLTIYFGAVSAPRPILPKSAKSGWLEVFEDQNSVRIKKVDDIILLRSKFKGTK